MAANTSAPWRTMMLPARRAIPRSISPGTDATIAPTDCRCANNTPVLLARQNDDGSIEAYRTGPTREGNRNPFLRAGRAGPRRRLLNGLACVPKHFRTAVTLTKRAPQPLHLRIASRRGRSNAVGSRDLRPACTFAGLSDQVLLLCPAGRRTPRGRQEPAALTSRNKCRPAK